MVVVLYVLSFLWGVVIVPICNALKKGVERTKTLPLGCVINFICTLVYTVFLCVAFSLPALLEVLVFKLRDCYLLSAWLLFAGMLFYAFLKREAIKAYIKDVHQRDGNHDTPSELASEIIEVDCRCRKCGMPYKYPYDRTSPMYGSPLWVCPKCGVEQADYRRLEPALDRRFGNWNTLRISIKVNVISLVVSVVLFLLGIDAPGSDRAYLCAYVLFITAFVFVSSIIITIESLLKKKPDFIKKSELRLKNAEYVAQLRKHGYEVPRK